MQPSEVDVLTVTARHRPRVPVVSVSRGGHERRVGRFSFPCSRPWISSLAIARSRVRGGRQAQVGNIGATVILSSPRTRYPKTSKSKLVCQPSKQRGAGDLTRAELCPIYLRDDEMPLAQPAGGPFV
jgi:hypothetical protein